MSALTALILFIVWVDENTPVAVFETTDWETCHHLMDASLIEATCLELEEETKTGMPT